MLVVADLTKGTGRFNLMQGALATATGIGASLSNLMTGYVVRATSQNVGFAVLTAIAGAALTFYALFVPETRLVSVADTRDGQHSNDLWDDTQPTSLAGAIPEARQG